MIRRHVLRAARVGLAASLLGAAVAGANPFLGNAPPAEKIPVPAEQTRVRDRQGGDTLVDAFSIDQLPFSDTGTTVGYADDYDAVCPYDGSTAPDVVYRFVPAVDLLVDVDLCGSGYDTKVYILTAGGQVVACNDDFYFGDPCGVYRSKIEAASLGAGAVYFIVIDGYGDEQGDYDLEVVGYDDTPCYVPYPRYWDDEAEPTLHDDYFDTYNGGCNSPPDYPFQQLHGWGGGRAQVYGRTGWYYFAGASYRDTDWFLATAGDDQIVATVDAEFEVLLYQISDFWDCDWVSIEQSATAGPCAPATLTIDTEFYETVCLWVGPTVHQPPLGFIGFEFNWVLEVEGLYEAVAQENTTWGALKSLYR